MGNCVGGEKAPKSNSETEQKSGNAELEKPKSNRILDGTQFILFPNPFHSFLQ